MTGVDEVENLAFGMLFTHILEEGVAVVFRFDTSFAYKPCVSVFVFVFEKEALYPATYDGNEVFTIAGQFLDYFDWSDGHVSCMFSLFKSQSV